MGQFNQKALNQFYFWTKRKWTLLSSRIHFLFVANPQDKIQRSEFSPIELGINADGRQVRERDHDPFQL